MTAPSPPIAATPAQGAGRFAPSDFARALVIACEAADCPLPETEPHDHVTLSAAGAEVGLDKKALADALWRAQMEKLSVSERNDLGLEKAGRKVPIVIGLSLALICVVAAVFLVVLFAQGRAAPRVSGDIDEARLSNVIDGVTGDAGAKCPHDVQTVTLAIGLRIGTEAQLLDLQIDGEGPLAECAAGALRGAEWPPALHAPVDVAFTMVFEAAE